MITNTEVPPTKTPRKSKLIILAVIIIIFVAGMTGYLLGTKSNKAIVPSLKTQAPAATPVFTPASQSSLQASYQYRMMQRTVKISDEDLLKTYFTNDPYITINAAVERTDSSTNKKEVIVKPLSDKLLGEMIAPSGCCAPKNDIVQHHAIQNDSYLIFIRNKLYMVDLKTKMISEMPTNYPKAYALEFIVSPDERYIFFESGDKHSSHYQEVIDLSSKTLYKLPEYSVGDEVFNYFMGFDKDKVRIADAKTPGEQSKPETAPQNLVSLNIYPSKNFSLNFVSQ